jgi:hypothetical protein
MFQFSAQGTREGVLKAIEAAQPNTEQDAPQVKSIKAYIAAEVAELPEGFNGCRVDANGDAHANSRSLQCTVIGMKLQI